MEIWDMIPATETDMGEWGDRGRQPEPYLSGIRGVHCPMCGAEFFPTPAHGWTLKGRKFCSYHCMRDAERGKLREINAKKTPATKREATHTPIRDRMEELGDYKALRRGKRGARIRQCEEKIREYESMIWAKGPSAPDAEKRGQLFARRWYWRRELVRAVNEARTEAGAKP